MSKFKKLLIIMLLALVTFGCKKEATYKVGDEITLSGKISINEIIKDGELVKISTLNLDEPIIIDGVSIKKVELSYDKKLKEGTETSIKGIITNSNSDMSYSLDVIDIDNVLSYINTYNHKDFTMTIPPSLMKITTVEQIEEGFIVYSTSNMDHNGEVFRIIKVSRKEFNKLVKEEKISFEKVASDTDRVIIIIYPTESNDYNEEYETIAEKISTIKSSVKIK